MTERPVVLKHKNKIQDLATPTSKSQGFSYANYTIQALNSERLTHGIFSHCGLTLER